jgi:tetratricopeptide (TPR) repeat protein
MAKKEDNKDLLENPEVIAEKLEGFEHWMEKNPRVILGVVAALVLVVGGYFGFSYYIDSQDAQAQTEMFQAVRYFETDSLNLALNGDGNNLGFKQITEDYPMTDAANLANFYAGAISLKQGNYSLAIFYLNEFSSNDILVQARAYALTGDAHMELKEYDKAAEFYHKASTRKPNKYFTPAYLMKEALAYELLQQNDKAIAAYDRIITEFWDTQEVQNAKKFKARLSTSS